MWGGTALGGVMAADGISKMPDNRANELALKGPDAFGKYNLNPIESAFINKDSLKDRRNKLLMDQTKKDPQVRAAQSLDPSLQITNGMDANDFLSTYSKQIRTAQQDEELTGAARVQAQLYNSPQQVEERRLQREARDDALKLQRDQMTLSTKQFAHTASENAKDRALTRDLDLSSTDLQMQMKLMDSELADKRMAYDRETRRMDRRDRMIAQLMSSLGQLGGAFAL